MRRQLDGQWREFVTQPWPDHGRKHPAICEVFVQMERTRWVFIGYTRRLPSGRFLAYPRQRTLRYVLPPAQCQPLGEEFRRRADAVVALWQAYRGGMPIEERPGQVGYCHLCHCSTSHFSSLPAASELAVCSECALTHRPEEILHWRNEIHHETHGMADVLSSLHTERGRAAPDQRTQHLAP